MPNTIFIAFITFNNKSSTHLFFSTTTQRGSLFKVNIPSYGFANRGKKLS